MLIQGILRTSNTARNFGIPVQPPLLPCAQFLSQGALEIDILSHNSSIILLVSRWEYRQNESEHNEKVTGLTLIDLPSYNQDMIERIRHVWILLSSLEV